MRPNVTPRNTWAQLGIGAGALLLPPLALGAALYSMLATPDEGATRPAGAQADNRAALADTPGPAVSIAQPATAEPMTDQPPAGKSAADVTRTWGQVSVQGGSVQASPVQVTSVQVTSVQVAVPPAGGVNPRSVSGSGQPAVDGPPAASAPKRGTHRRAQRQEEYPLRNWLQQIGILPRNSGTGGS